MRLQLTRIIDTFDGRTANVHFVDKLADGEIQFDYRMRPGVVQTGNALALMRSLDLNLRQASSASEEHARRIHLRLKVE